MKPIDYVIGSIKDLETDRLSMQSAYFKKEAECEALREKIRKLIKKYDRLTPTKNRPLQKK